MIEMILVICLFLMAVSFLVLSSIFDEVATWSKDAEIEIEEREEFISDNSEYDYGHDVKYTED